MLMATIKNKQYRIFQLLTLYIIFSDNPKTSIDKKYDAKKVKAVLNVFLSKYCL
jgi:hypothetical protein